jgi:hypothetical protein
MAMEYCGNEILEEGLSMSKKKDPKGLRLPKPQTADK